MHFLAHLHAKDTNPHPHLSLCIWWHTAGASGGLLILLNVHIDISKMPNELRSRPMDLFLFNYQTDKMVIYEYSLY